MALVIMISGIPISSEHAACCDATKQFDIESTDWYLVSHSGTKAGIAIPVDSQCNGWTKNVDCTPCAACEQ